MPSPNEAAANTLGVLGAVAWSVQLIPQIIINYRRHHAIGLQPAMMLLWACAGIPLGVYNIVQNFNVALRVQAQILTTLSLVTLGQCLYYQSKWPKRKCFAVLGALGVIMGGVEAGLILGLRAAKTHNITWPVTLMAVLSAVLLGAGVGAHYIDIWKHRSVRGISFFFVGIDASGDLFSLLSLFFQSKFDVLGSVIYSVELGLWVGVMGCGVAFNLIPWSRRLMSMRRSGEGNTDYDNAVNQAHQGNPAIAMHDLPSSTSVFTTASEGLNARARRGDVSEA